MKYDSGCASDRGLVRENNEDSCYCQEIPPAPGDALSKYGIYIVADGMGGHRAGEIASRTAVETIIASLAANPGSIPQEDYGARLVDAIVAANNAIYTAAQNDKALVGMGTTVTAALLINDRAFLGHAGDSRAYLFRDRKIIRLTSDHSLVANLVKAGMISEQEARTHPDRNKIYRSLGTDRNVAVDTYRTVTETDSLGLRSGDILLLCTDGLHSMLEDNEIQTVVRGAGTARDICSRLIADANRRGGFDNTSVIVVKAE